MGGNVAKNEGRRNGLEEFFSDKKTSKKLFGNDKEKEKERSKAENIFISIKTGI